MGTETKRGKEIQGRDNEETSPEKSPDEAKKSECYIKKIAFATASKSLVFALEKALTFAACGCFLHAGKPKLGLAKSLAESLHHTKPSVILAKFRG